MKRKFNDVEAVDSIKNKELTSVSAVLRMLGANPVSGTNHVLIKRIAAVYKIDTAHWLGCRSSLGRKYPERKVPLEKLLVDNKKYQSTELRLRLLEEGLKQSRCECCRLDCWNGRPIPLELHHANGNTFDNRLGNLQLLCPNCHAQTPNYRAKNIRRRV